MPGRPAGGKIAGKFRFFLNFFFLYVNVYFLKKNFCRRKKPRPIIELT